jgi:2-oxoglutarate dehydrogenase E2 component (dihydrolipoamide succinyltransferase)
MSTEILMPQMGESVAEGTIVRWIKRVGDPVDKDEPLFEISTDKVDAEIPSPGAGVLLEIRAHEGETVPVNSVVGVIGAGTGTLETGVQPGASAEIAALAVRPAPPAAGAGRPVTPAAPARPTGKAEPPRPVRTGLPGSPADTGRSVAVPPVAVPPVAGSRLRTLSSPLVRTIAREHGVDITRVPGTGVAGRVTRRDIEAYIADGGARKGAGRRTPVEFADGAETHVEKMSVMRRKIAEHMSASVKTSAHVYSAYEADFGQVDRLRREHRARYDAAGSALTYTAFIAKATADTIREFPFVNASLDGENIVYHRDINIGIAVALEQGLIVPVIRQADRLSMLDLCRAIQDLAHRARTKQLKHEDVEAGTFTITNPGIFGGLWGLPIISQPQVAILAVGSVDKRVVVVDDEVTIRPMCYLTLGYDHRLIDGADGGRFLQALKTRLERFDEALL